MYVSGTLYNYYHICKRKVWFSSRGISLEDESDAVQIGKLIDENSYGRERKHIMADEFASIDFMRDSTIFEVKKSTKEKEASISQLLYYLYILKKKGIETTGELRVPKENYIEKVELTDEDELRIERELIEIEELAAMTEPPAMPEGRGICRSCAFYEFCGI